jgi:hypothetical protein
MRYRRRKPQGNCAAQWAGGSSPENDTTQTVILAKQIAALKQLVVSGNAHI